MISISVLDDLIERLDNLQPTLMQIAKEILSEDLDVLLELQKDQLYAGRDVYGQFISPTYLNDSFFDDSASAQRYAEWKSRLLARDSERATSIFGAKPYDVPDLIVTGELVYKNISVTLEGNKLVFTFGGEGGVINTDKYRGALDGLNDVAWAYYREEFFLPKLKQRVENYLKH